MLFYLALVPILTVDDQTLRLSEVLISVLLPKDIHLSPRRKQKIIDDILLIRYYFIINKKFINN